MEVHVLFGFKFFYDEQAKRDGEAIEANGIHVISLEQNHGEVFKTAVFIELLMMPRDAHAESRLSCKMKVLRK